MNRFLFFLLFLFPLALAAQPANGKYTERHPEGKLALKGQYRNGKKTGQWTYWHYSGELQKTETYVDGKLEGLQRTYADVPGELETRIASEVNYVNGLREGKFFEHNRSANTSVTGQYEKGKKQGPWKYFEKRFVVYDNKHSQKVDRREFSRLAKEENYRDDLLHGAYVTYDQNNVKLIEGTYENGLRQGEFREWGKGYKFRYERWYSRDSLVREIELESWGLKKKETGLRAGIRHGIYREWHKDGRTLKLEGNYDNGKRHGLFTEWRSDGTKRIEYTYEQEHLTGVKREYNAGGILELACYLKDGVFDGSYTTFHPDGSADGKWTCVNGNFEGRFERRYPDGSLAEEGNYVNDMREGKFTGYYQHGMLKFTAHYKNGMLNGVYQEFHTNGKKYIVQNFVNDKPAGAPVFLDSQGKKMKKRPPAPPGPRSVTTVVGQRHEYTPVYSGGYEIPKASEPLDLLHLEAGTYEAQDSKVDKEIVVHVSEGAEFPGGEAAMSSFFSKNIRYPEMEKENGIMGTVFLSFDISPEGKVENVLVLKEVPGGAGLSREAIRVARSMPHWKPAKEDGRAVTSTHTHAIRFSLQ